MRIKLIWIALLVILIISLPVLSSCNPATTTTPTQTPTTSTPTTTPVKPIELTYSNFFPPTHLNSILAQLWIKEIETRTGGKVKITYYPGGTLTPAAKIYDGVVQGLSDIGMSVLAYTVGRFPASELIDLPHGYPSGWVATKVANDFYANFKPAEFNDTQVLYFHAHGPGVLLTANTKVQKMEDLKGLVIRCTGVGAQIISALGGSPNAAAQGEVVDLMTKGTVHGSFSPREVLKGWNQAEAVKYVTMTTDLGYTANMFVTINKDKWNSLPADVQKVFTDVSQEWIEKHGMVWTYYDKVALDYFKTFPGREIVELPKDEMQRWADVAVKPLIDKYISEKSAKGLSAADYEKYLLERVTYWSGKTPTEAEMISWVEKNVLPAVPAPTTTTTK